jgi:general secretion pathway protein J
VRPAGSSAAAGFTLLELLVALTIASFVAAAMLSALRIGARAERSASTRLLDEEAVALSYDFLREEIAGARPAQTDAGSRPGSRAAVLFDGAPDRISFVAPIAAGGAAPGLHSVTIGAEVGGGGVSIVLRAVPRAGGGAGAPLTPLLSRLRSVEFSYFGDLGGAGPAWSPAWSGGGGLPILVRLHAVSADGRPLPELVVAVRAAARRPAEAANRGSP